MTRHHHHPRSVRLSKRRRLLLYAVGLGLWGSGILWLCFHYFLETEGEFGRQTNPLEPWWLAIHGGFAMATLWSFGLVWGIHVETGWRGTRRVVTGSIVVGVLGWLIVSGYLLYYLGDETARNLVSLLHWIVGALLPVAFVTHRFGLMSREARARRRAAGPRLSGLPTASPPAE